MVEGREPPPTKGEGHHLQKWLEFTQKIFSTLEMNEALQTILDVALELTEMERGFVVSHGADGEPQFMQGRDERGRVRKESDFSDTDDLVKRCFQKKEPIHFDEHTQDFQPPAACGFCAPLFSYRDPTESKRLIGAIYAESTRQMALGNLERELISVIALHAGMSLENVMLYEVATRDPLTHVYLRHYFDAIAFVEWKRTLRHKHPLSILIADLDDFRFFNDAHGKAEGDSILQQTADIMKDACRIEDIIARYGGEEFVALLPETNVAGARRVARRIQDRMAEVVQPKGSSRLTVSIGAATYPQCYVTNVQDLVKLAEHALGQAKQAGKNRTIVYEPTLSQAHEKLFH